MLKLILMFSNLSHALPSKKIIILFISFFLLASYFSEGYNNLDEHYQILEFATWKLGIPSSPPWELGAEIRPTLQPTLVYLLYKFLDFFFYDTQQINPFLISFMLRLISMLLSITAIAFMVDRFLPEVKEKYHQAFILLSGFIFFFPYHYVRFSSENFTRIFFVFALCNTIHLLTKQKPNKSMDYFWIGLLAGISFLFRFQIGFAIVGLFAWLWIIKKVKIVPLTWMVMGIITTIAVGFLLDSWFYGNPVFTPWNYLKVNIFEGKASSFGVDAWYYYFIETSKYTLLVFPVFVISPIIFFFLFPRHIITWTSIPFLLIHFYLGHKEIRFLLPLISFYPIYIIQTLSSLEKWKIFKKFQTTFIWRGWIKYFWIINSFAFIVFVIFPPSTIIKFHTKFLYDNYKKANIYYHKNTENLTISKQQNFFYARRDYSYNYIKFIETDEISKNYCSLSQKIKNYPIILISAKKLKEPFFRLNNSTKLEMKKSYFFLLDLFKENSKYYEELVSSFPLVFYFYKLKIKC